MRLFSAYSNAEKSPMRTKRFDRYQFDPTPNIHDSMTNIWKVLVTDPQTTVAARKAPFSRGFLTV